jgi:hypothetical protein
MPQRPVLGALALGGAEVKAGDLGQQVGAVAGDFPEFGGPAGLLCLGQVTPAGIPPGDGVQPGHEQAVRVRSAAIISHLARIEHADDKCKLALLVSVHCYAGKEQAMAALTPASPDSLPPIGELIADEPAWRYPVGTAAEGVAHLRVWPTSGPGPGHLAVVTETGSAAVITLSAGRIWAELARRYGPSLVLLEHHPAPETGEGAETLDLVRIGADGSPRWLRVWPTPEEHARHAGLELWMANYGYQIVDRPASWFDRCEDETG